MTLESFLLYFTNHVESIIQWIFLAILMMAAILIARGLFGKKDASAGTGASPDLQALLDKIMAQTAKLENVSLKEMSPAGVAEVEAQVQALKKDLAAREEEIGKLKAAGGEGGKAGEDAAQLASRIKELEAKLAEYEILEDDIADLSLYKEENSRLKEELEKARGGAAPVAAAAEPVPAAAAATAEPQPPPAPVPEPAPAPASVRAESGEAIVAEFAQAVSHEPAGAALGPDSADLAIPDTGNPMADFESTVQLERKLTGAAPAAAEPAPAPAAAAPAPKAAPAPAVAPAAPATEADDLFAEFSKPASESHDPLEGSTLDTDKMMEEMAALVSMEPSQGNALEEGIDIEKMALEAKAPGKS